jgi:hypothetical protein
LFSKKKKMREKKELKKIQNFESELAWLPSGSRSNHDARLSKKAHTICSSL